MRKEIVKDIFTVKEQNRIKASECCYPYKDNGYKTLSEYTQYLKSEVKKNRKYKV